MSNIESAKLHDSVASPEAGDDRVLAAWESPEAVEISLGQARTANTNSNFDGSNASC